MNHLGDDAELYALGFTDRERSDAIESHITTCAECRASVVAAESAAAALASALPREPVRVARRHVPWWTSLAMAAAVVFAVSTAIEGNAAATASRENERTGTALVAIASSHFGHATLVADRGIIAKVIYARDAAWYYVVATGTPNGAHVVIRRHGTQRDLGALSSAIPATLFARAGERADEVEIVAGDHVVAHAKPAY